MDKETTRSVESRTLSNKSTSTAQRRSQAVFRVTSRHDHQRVPHSFRYQPTSSTRPEIRQRTPRLANKEHARHRIQQRSATCLPCICSVSCAQLSFTLEPDNGLCDTHDECAGEPSLSMSRPVYRLNMPCGWCVAQTWLTHMRSSQV